MSIDKIQKESEKAYYKMLQETRYKEHQIDKEGFVIEYLENELLKAREEIRINKRDMSYNFDESQVLMQEFKEQEEEKDNLECCGNCNREKACGIKDTRKLMNPNFNKCNNWNSDNLTKQQREV